MSLYLGQNNVKIENNSNNSNYQVKIGENISQNLWNMSNRQRFNPDKVEGTFYYVAEGSYKTSGTSMPLSEQLYWRGGRHLYGGCYYNYTAMPHTFCTITETFSGGFSLISGNTTETYVAFPFHLNKNETLTIGFEHDAHVRGGYQIFNLDGTLKTTARENISASDERHVM